MTAAPKSAAPVSIPEGMTPEQYKTAFRTLVRWRNDALAFAKEVIHPETISPMQERILRSISKPRARVSVVTGQGCGKTAVLAWVVNWAALCFTDMRIVCTAPVFKQLEQGLWPEIAKWRARMPPAVAELVVWQKQKVYHAGAEEACFAVMRASNAGNAPAFQGTHAKNALVIFDEASGIPDVIWQAAAGTALQPGGRWLVVGNGNYSSGAFFDTHHKNAEMWEHFSASSLDSPFSDEAYCKMLAEEYGADSNTYRIRVLGLFPQDDPNTLIRHDLVQRAFDRQQDAESAIRPDEKEKRVLGIDPNGGGSDSCGLAIRRGNLAYGFQELNGMDHLQIAGRVKRLWDNGMFDYAACEANGVGIAVVADLAHLGIPVVAVDVSRPAAFIERCKLVRDELWWQARQWFESGVCGIQAGFPPEKADDPSRRALERFMHEVSVPQYEDTAKITVEGKKSLRRAERLGRSPDLGDAFIMTFAKGQPRYQPWMDGFLEEGEPVAAFPW